ncbi:hypothetical protein ACOKGD_02045 [Microbacterium phosphatis]|uniref:hypothetical protein n=1 Tax=Microbacterium phosphatis TaxID=3140248 RepID=UPI003140B953
MAEHERAAEAAAAPRRRTFLPSAEPVAPGSIADGAGQVAPILAAPAVRQGATRAPGMLPAAAAVTLYLDPDRLSGGRREHAARIAAPGAAAAAIAVIAAAFAPPLLGGEALRGSPPSASVAQPFPSSAPQPLAAEGGRVRVDLHGSDEPARRAEGPRRFDATAPDVPVRDAVEGAASRAAPLRGQGSSASPEAAGGLPVSAPQAGPTAPSQPVGGSPTGSGTDSTTDGDGSGTPSAPGATSPGTTEPDVAVPTAPTAPAPVVPSEPTDPPATEPPAAEPPAAEPPATEPPAAEPPATQPPAPPPPVTQPPVTEPPVTQPPAPLAPTVTQTQSPTSVLAVGGLVQVATRYHLAVTGQPDSTVTISGGLLGLQAATLRLDGSGYGTTTMDVLVGLGTPTFTVR